MNAPTSCDPTATGSVREAANDNGDNGRIGAVREIDLGPKSAETISDLLRTFRVADLRGARLLHASAEVQRTIYLEAGDRAREAFGEFARGDSDVLIVSNLFAVRKDLEPTSGTRAPSLKARRFSLPGAGLARCCGYLPVAVSSENGGFYDRHVRVERGRENERSSAGKTELGPHNEHSSRNNGGNGQRSPLVDTICIAGLRNDSNEATGFATLQQVLTNLSATSISVLQEPIYGMAPPDSSSERGTSLQVPILYNRFGRLECAYRADKVHVPAERLDAHRAVSELNTAIRAAAQAVTLTPGRAWLARNPRCFHWRDEIKNPSRWLVRGFGMAPSTAAIYASSRRPDLVVY